MVYKFVVDTNVLLRFLNHREAQHVICVKSINTLRKNGNVPILIPQTLCELAAVLTRPRERNGMGLSVRDANEQLDEAETLFDVILDTPEVYAHWRRLFVTIGASGRQVHDMRIAAAMAAHGVGHILTYNGDDFKRYSDITVIRPADVVV